ncbi:MAG: hypothetical protein KDC38_17390 [Planctomycetes bacterium]|nr:hypothetical protein [Planctomycetota bacterium]
MTLRSLLGGLALAGVLSGSLPSAASAQDESDALRAKYAEKLEKQFAKVVEWELDLAGAKKACASKNRPIIAYFTRSYAP